MSGLKAQAQLGIMELPRRLNWMRQRPWRPRVRRREFNRKWTDLYTFPVSSCGSSAAVEDGWRSPKGFVDGNVLQLLCKMCDSGCGPVSFSTRLIAFTLSAVGLVADEMNVGVCLKLN